MILLPVAGSLGVHVIPEIILVLRLGQPSPHELAFPGLAAIGLEAIALALSTPVIGKKKFLAVQALASGLRWLHWFQNKKEPVSETGAKRGNQIQQQEKSNQRRRKKNFQRICRRKSNGRRSRSKPPGLHPFDFAADIHRQKCLERVQVVAVDDEIIVERGLLAFGRKRFLRVNKEFPKRHRKMVRVNE